MNNTKNKIAFKMPHLFWIMLGLILVMSLLTYVVPAGAFAKDDAGNLIGSVFTYLDQQTPVTPWRAGMLMMDGLTGSAIIIFMVMVSGAAMQVTLDTKAIDNLLNFSLKKLSTKGVNVLIPALFMLMVYIGAFGGSDALIAVVPVGVLFAKKLKLDPIVALGVTTFATMIGFGTGPTKLFIIQAMLGVPLFSGFGARFIIMNLFALLGLYFVMAYVRKIQKNPELSKMGNTDWQKELSSDDDNQLAEGKFNLRTILIIVLFLGQYIAFVLWGFTANGGKTLFQFMTFISILVAVVSGLIAEMKFEDIANSFAKGFANMAFVGFAIGMARIVSLVMSEGNILHTLVYILTRPLLGLDKGIATVGITAVISVINVFIPSATSKAAILVPIIKPIAETLQINNQMAAQAFQFGDGFTNIISPILGWTIGSCAIAKVSYDKWLKWAYPKVIIMILISFVMVYVLNMVGWTGL